MSLVGKAIVVGLAALAGVSAAHGQVETRSSTEYGSAYAPPSAADEPGVNEGGVRFDLIGRYMTDYVYRGIDYSEVGAGSEDAVNAQIDARLSFDLGKAPHPFIGVFVNVFDDDPISRFQEIRPQVGLEWTVRPFRFTVAHNAYLYPDREDIETSEVFVTIEADDAFFLKTDEPVLWPYLTVAYDYDRNRGWYLETGIRHSRDLGDTGLVALLQANVAYTIDHPLYSVDPADDDGTGFQHYDLGLVLRYDLNRALGGDARWGLWSLEGYLWYTDGMDPDLRSTTQLWGGAGIHFRY